MASAEHCGLLTGSRAIQRWSCYCPAVLTARCKLHCRLEIAILASEHWPFLCTLRGRAANVIGGWIGGRPVTTPWTKTYFNQDKHEASLFDFQSAFECPFTAAGGPYKIQYILHADALDGIGASAASEWFRDTEKRDRGKKKPRLVMVVSDVASPTRTSPRDLGIQFSNIAPELYTTPERRHLSWLHTGNLLYLVLV